MTPFEVVNTYYKFPDRINPHQLQIEVINDLAPIHNSGEFLDMGCVDSETEYLSPGGWLKIADYVSGPVAQFVPGNRAQGRAEFVTPMRYIKEPCEEMVALETTRGVSQRLSTDHRVLYADSLSRLKEVLAGDLHDQHQRLAYGWKGRFVTTFQPPLRKGLEITDEKLRLTVAVIADGHFPTDFSPVTVRVKKQRKIDRLRNLLVSAGVDYTEKEEHWDGCEGFVRFIFRAPMPGTKAFGPMFYKASEAQLRIIIDEVPHWDSAVSTNPKRGFRFFSSEKQSADFVQYALCAVGVRSTVSYQLRRREGRAESHEYAVQAFARSNLAYVCGCSVGEQGIVRKTHTVWKEPATDGFQYCFTVPSSYLILRRNGCVFVTGNCGKTFCSTAIGLYHKIKWGHQVVVIMPPILLRQWGRWLAEIRPELTVTEYRGTPAQRKAMDLEVDFVLVGSQIFKKEYERFTQQFFGKPYTVIVDEATMAGNIESDTHQKIFDFCIGHPVTVLTGTPMNAVMDAYGLLKFSAPGHYHNLRDFIEKHVDGVDFYKKPNKFKNLDALADAMLVNSKRILFEDMYPGTEAPMYDPVYYDLEPAHYKLYAKLANEELLRLPDGGKIDGTTANKLLHALGQIVCNWGHFSGVPSNKATAIDMIEQKLAELGDGKLVVFAHYKMTVAYLKEHLKKYGVVTVNSEVTDRQKDKNVQAFIHDPRCRVMVAQFISAGKGSTDFSTSATTRSLLSRASSRETSTRRWRGCIASDRSARCTSC